MQVRVARHTQRLDEVVAFYRDGIGLPELGGFRGHEGYDGVFLDLPGTGAHLELTDGGEHGAPLPHPESLLVLYLGDERAVQEVAARLERDPVRARQPLLGRARPHLRGSRRLQGRARSRAFPGLSARTAAGCSTTGSAVQSGWPGIRGVVSP